MSFLPSLYLYQDIRKELNVQIVECLLAKLVPSAGRSAKAPEQLLEVLRALVHNVTSRECLTADVHADLETLGMAMRNVDAEDNLESLELSARDLAKMAPDQISESSVLFFIANVTAFRCRPTMQCLRRGAEESLRQGGQHCGGPEDLD